ncbi:uncharacterized protein [Choristoneura fumiferana]|uniref:uncharacterized protein n=1 Tax=Choristoneura fumiferana TaxID=7141 RepID=UPI003D15451E
MSYQIKYLSLQKTELEYEVGVRGGSTGESVQELRKQIVKLAPVLPPEDILESHLDSKVDLSEVKDTLVKTKENLDILKAKFDKNVYSRTETMLHHIYYRLIRINREEATDSLYKECSHTFKQHFALLKNLKMQIPSTASSTAEPLSDIISVTCEKKLVSDVVGKLRYSGKSCVRSFIQKAEELVISRSMPKDKLLTFAYEIFTDDALHWYRCIKDKVESWDDLVKLLKQDFSQSDYDYRLLSEIRMRTQGEQENISIYISIMHGMFSRLNKQLTEEDKLEILLHNIRPTYASTLAASPNINSIDALKDLCRSYENIQSRTAQFHEPPKINSEMLAREFAYNRQSPSTSFHKHNYHNNNGSPTYKQNYIDRFKNYKPNYNNNSFSKNDSEHSKKTTVNSLNTPTSSNTPVLYCPRCRVNTHSLGQCHQPHYPICFKCGKKGVRYPDCLDCRATSTQKN